MLPHLPMSRRESLQSLHVDVQPDTAHLPYTIVAAISIALMECRHLKSFTISRSGPGLFLPELDLSHLRHLKTCRLQCLPAPYRIYMLKAKLELTIQYEYVTSWSKQWHQVQDHARCIKIEEYKSSIFKTKERVLMAWPKGIDSFHGLQYLQMTYELVQPRSGDAVIDLACLAYIPHVSLRSKSDLSVRISSGSWKVLDIQSQGAFNIAIDNAEVFIKSTNAFYFIFPSNRKPENVIEKLGKAGADIFLGSLYECQDKCIGRRNRHKGDRDVPLTMLSNQELKHRKANNGFFSFWKRHGSNLGCE